ncbi:NACHT domain-containing protein [Candidatus Fervidibacteria bacterium JGI MDM2 SSWTFF-3-K9]
MAHRCPKCGKEMARHGNFWICGDHAEPVFIPIEHPFSDLCASLPTPIAFVLDEFFRESNPFVALWRMVDAAEIITRFLTITVLSDILRQKGEFPQPVKIALTEKLERPTFGAWKDLLAIAIDNLPKEKGQTRCFAFELPSFVRDKWLPALGSGEDKPEEKLIALRNFIAHAGRLPEEKAQELLNAHRQRFESLVKELSFLANYDLIACTKEGQIFWLKGLPSADGSFPEFERSLSFSPALERVYLVHGDDWLDLFPLHAFTDILQWREELYDFERLGEIAPQIYFRLSERGYLECISFSTKAVFSHLGKDAYQRFRDIFRLEEWRAQRKSEAEAQGIQKLWDELVNELTEVFVGREEHVRQVKEAVKGKSKGFLWISGKPGVGKSALMAKLMKDYIGQTQHYIVIPYFFRFGQAGLSTMDFLATALKRLQGELKRTIEPAPNLPDRQQQLVEALEEAVSKTGKKVLFLVDGLDEIYRQEREFLNVPFMTVREGILWVCAGRSEDDLEEALRSRGAEWIFPEGLPPLDEQAIRAMLVEHLGRLKYALFERDEGQRNRFVEAVTRKSEGLPLYVRMVIEDLKAGQLTVWDEDKLPNGLVAYYERLLERMRVSDVGTVLTPLFCLLAWAKEPVTEGTMKFLLQTHHLARSPRWSELFRRALEHGHLMLQQRPTPDGEVGWTIYHDSFRQHLLESKTVSDNREWAQERWLEVCRDWKALASQEPSLHRYILRHYADHLHERWQMTDAQPQIPDAQHLYSALCQLALDTEFTQSQTLHLPDEPNLPLKTVQLALDAAIKREDAPMMAKLVIEHAKRAQSEEETPLQAWRKGHWERALKTATEIIFERNHKLGTLWGLLLAWEAESKGERDWAKRFLDEVRKRWEGAKLTELGYWQGEMAVFLLGELWQVEGAIEVAGLVLDDESKRDLATSWASKGLFEQALKVAEGIRWAGERARALSEIAVEMAKAGMKERAKEVFEQALKVAEGIEDAWWRARALSEIAEEMAKAGMFEKAMKVAEGIRWAGERAGALSEIAKEMAKVGMKEQAKEVFEQALKVAEGIEDARERAEVLKAIASEMAKAGMFEKAMKVAEGIEYARFRARALSEIAKEMAKVGMKEQAKEVFEQALKVAEGIEDARERAEVLGAIAEEMAKAGMFGQALELAKEIKNAWRQSEALRVIVEEMAKARMFDQAMKVAEGIEYASERAKALGAIAEEMAKARMFDQAMKVAEGIEYASERAKALGAIAEEMVKARMFEQAKEVFDQALKLAGRLKDEWELAWTLRAIFERMTKVRMFDQALKLAEGIWDIAKALAAIAGGTAKAGMLDQALELAKEIKNALWQSEALRVIAEEMAKARMLDQAFKVAEGIEDAWRQSQALRVIVEEMAKARMFDQALELTEKIWDTGEQLGASAAIAEEMAKARMFDQALELAERSSVEPWQLKALRVIVEEMAKAGMLDQALELAEKILAEKSWERVLELELLVTMVNLGFFDQALEVAEGIWGQAEVFKAIAEKMAEENMMEQAREFFNQALRAVGRIEEAWERAKALKEIAEGMAKVGMLKQAKEVFDQALKVAEGIKEVFDQTLKVAEEIEDADERARAIVKAIVKSRIEVASWRAWTLWMIAEGMAKVGMVKQAKEVFDQALKVAEGIEDVGHQVGALTAIAVGMARVGEVESAVGIVERATGMRTKMLLSVLSVLTERAREGDVKSKEGFFRLFPLCGWSLKLAYKACGLLAWLYPEQGEAIAKVVSGE